MTARTANLLPLQRAGIDAIARRYPGRFNQGYARGKLAADPAFAAVAGELANAPPLQLLDIGCGMGLLGQYLAASDLLHGYLGIDLDERRIAAARVAAAGLEPPLAFQLGHADLLPPHAGHVAMLDMLHYLPAPAQAALLAAAAARLAPGGRLLIRNVLREHHWRFHVTRAEEWLLHACGRMRVAAQHFPTAAGLERPLVAHGLAVTVRPLHGRTPFNSYLVTAVRPA